MQRYLSGPAAAGRALDGRRAGRRRLVHGRQRLEQERAQRVRRAVAARRHGDRPRRPLRPRRAARDRRSASASRSLCMAPTEYRMIAKRVDAAARCRRCARCVAAGEALDPGVIAAWREAAGVEIRDGYGQTETGQLTGFAPGETVRPGSMGRPLPGVDLRLQDGELVADPRPCRRSSAATAASRRPRATAVAHRRPRRGRRRRLPVVPRAAPTTSSSPPATASGRSRSSRRSARTRPSRRPRRSPRPTTSAARSCARSSCCATATPASDELVRDAADARQGGDGAVQVPAPRRLRRRAAEDAERQDQARRAARRLKSRSRCACAAARAVSPSARPSSS